MFSYKINNLLKGDCTLDYKGLDLNLIIAGTQIYNSDYSFCLLVTTEDVATNGDLVQITEAEYNTLKQEIIDAIPVPEKTEAQINSEKIALLQEAMNAFMDMMV